MRPLEATPTRRDDGNEKEPVLVAEDGARIPLVNTEPGVQSTLNLDQMAKLPLLPSLAAEDSLRNSIDMVPGVTVTPSTPTASTPQVDGSSLGTLDGSRPPPKPIKISLSHINVKELQRRFTMPATMPVSNTLLPTSNNNYAVDVNPRGDSWAMSRRQQRRLSSKKDLERPLYRKDIFYSGSIVHLPQYRQSKHDIRCYISSVTTIPQVTDDEDELEKLPQKGKRRRWCPKLPKSMTDTLKEALDFSLLQDRSFILACVANVLGMAGFYVPFVYITANAMSKEVEADAAAFILSIIGIANLCGRLFFGWLVDRLGVKAIDVNNFCLAISGISVMAIPFCQTYGTIVAACTIFGAFVSAYISLTSIILVDMVGLDKLTNSFGLLSLFRGAASIVGPPFAGTLKDLTGSYDVPFFVAGALLIASGICMLLIPILNKNASQSDMSDCISWLKKKLATKTEQKTSESDPKICL